MIVLFRHVAGFFMFVMSSTVIILNSIVVWRLRKEREGFHKICINKAFANCLIGMAFLTWSTPCSILNLYYLPSGFNIFFGVIVGWGPYLMSGPFTQICLAVNRFVAIYLPYQFNKNRRLPYTKLILGFLWITAMGLSLPSLRDGCSYIFYIESVSWGPMDNDCSRNLSEYVTDLVIIMAATSFLTNVISIGRILRNATISGVSEDISASRRKKRMKMFIQCIIQDCTHTCDCLINTYVYTFYDVDWFQFMCGAVSALTVISLDGFLMFFLHQKSNTPAAVTNRNSKVRSSSRVSVSMAINTTTV